MTFSVLARCPRTGELGVATQSHWPFNGARVPWGQPGVGVIATQATTEPSYGPSGLAILAQRVAPEPALQALLEGDAATEERQVGMLDRHGRFAHHTGEKVLDGKNTIEREGALFLGNMLTGAEVVDAMAASWDQTAELNLGWRMVRALEAAQDAGGDIRGQQSAALLVVAGVRTVAWDGVIAHIRIDDDPQPLVSLNHLLNVREAYNDANDAELAVTQHRISDAIECYQRAQNRLPRSAEIAFWRSFALAEAGQLENASEAFRICKNDQGNWTELARRLHAAGRLSISVDDLEIVVKDS